MAKARKSHVQNTTSNEANLRTYKETSGHRLKLEDFGFRRELRERILRQRTVVNVKKKNVNKKVRTVDEWVQRREQLSPCKWRALACGRPGSVNFLEFRTRFSPLLRIFGIFDAFRIFSVWILYENRFVLFAKKSSALLILFQRSSRNGCSF